MAGLADRFDRRFLVVSPRAPLQVGPFAFAWLRVTFTPDGPVIDADEARDAWATAGRFVDEAVGAYGADPERVFLAGFSQGGIVALGTILTEPERVTGAVCMSGRLPPEVLPLLAPDERLRGRPILIVHGRDDETLGIGFARSARAILEGLPVVLTYRELELGHTTSEESLGLVADWLAARLDS
jgi:phospholipase/carboxylesterase